MGGFGSGRYAAGYERGKQVVEQYPVIDIKQFKKFLYESRKTEYVSSNDDNVLLIKEIIVDPEEMNIHIVFKGKEDLVYIDKTACHFGGWRHWFNCPCCNKRVGKLYHGHYGFACRECYNLNYLSQQLSKTDSYYHNLQAERIAKKIDPHYKMDYSHPRFPNKPKYMKFIPYFKLQKKFYNHIDKSWSLFLRGASRILSA